MGVSLRLRSLAGMDAVHLNAARADTCYGGNCPPDTPAFPIYIIIVPIIAGVCMISMFAFACYRIRHRRPYVIGMPERPAQLSSQQRFQAYLPPLTDRPLPYSGVPPPNTHVESIPTPRPYQRGTLVPDLERGLSSSHNRVSSEDVRPSIHDPLLRDQSRSRSPTPVIVSEPTPPAKTYQGHESPPAYSLSSSS